MASTHTSQESSKSFLEGFDGRSTYDQVYMFQDKLNDDLLVNCLLRVEYESADPATVANYLENFHRFTEHTDPAILQKAAELGAAWRTEFVD